MSHKSTFSVRAEKTGTFRDDLRVMMAGVLFCIFLILMQPFVFRIHDYFVAERPFVSATLKIVGVPGSDVPMIKYDADATQNVTGTWIASVHHADDSRITSRRGKGSYNNLADDPKFWTWSAFFDNEQDVASPDIPKTPFKVCVRYDVEASDSGVDDSTEKFCSEVYDPANPEYEIPDFHEEGLY